MKIPIESSTSYRGRNYRLNRLALAGFIAATLAVGYSSGRFAGNGGDWYVGLAKPAWTPPGSWFAPIWTALYVLMGIAAWLVWRERYHRSRQAALASFTLQLMVNAAWAPVFFGARSLGAGLFVIVTLWLCICWMLREFAAVRSAAAWLLVPYLAWVTIAAALNLSIWRHNQ